MNAKIKILIEQYSIKILGYMLFILLCVLYGYFVGKIINVVFILITYTLTRWCYPTTWHASNTIRCLIFSVLAFMVLTKLSLSMGLSILSCAIVSMIFTYTMYIVDLGFQKYYETHNRKTILDLTKEELYSLMENSNLSQEEKDAIEYKYIYKYKGDYLYKCIGYCKRNCLYLIKRGKEKLNKLIK